MVTGEKAPVLTLNMKSAPETGIAVQPVGMSQFSPIVNAGFIAKMENVVTSQDVCKIMNVPVSTMRVFSAALNPKFDFENDIGTNFKNVVISLLTVRKEREKQKPIRMLFDMDMDGKVLEGEAILEIEIGN